MSKETKKTSKQLVLGLAILCAVALGAYAFYVTLEGKNTGDDWSGIKPPETLGPVTHTDESGSVITPTTGDEPNPKIKWREGVYSFLVLGADASEMRPDVIMLVVFDTNQKTLNVMHIPRDTYSNAPNNRPSYHKHINLSLAYGGKANFDGMIEEVSHLIGYKVSGYVFVDMKGFVNLINFIGGVEFNVPRDMVYSDPTQNLYINIKKGQQVLNGKKALELMRFRSGYSDADIGRIKMRSEFLKAAAAQILSKNNISRAGELAGVLLDNVKTSLSKSEMLELAEHALQLDPNNIRFETLPGGPAKDSGYWVPYKNEILDLINEKFNPFDAPITYINIVERDENRGK